MVLGMQGFGVGLDEPKGENGVEGLILFGIGREKERVCLRGDR